MIIEHCLMNGLRYRLELPDDWSISLAAPTGLTGHPNDERQIQFFISPLISLIRGTFEEKIADYMGRRVPEWGPGDDDEAFAVVVGGVKGKGYLWTDGVRSIATWMLQPGGRDVLIECATYGAREWPHQVGDRVLSRLTWLQATGAEASSTSQ